MTEPIADPRPLRWRPNTPISPFVVINTIVSTSDVPPYDPEGRTTASSKGEDDEWSDENIERWLERDKLDPELAEWVRATLEE